MDDLTELIERLYDALNRRDLDEIAAVCDEEMELFPPVTAGAVGRSDPYVGLEGLRSYLDDSAQIWEELLITPCKVERRGDHVLVNGRVYGRSRDFGIRDLPAAWLWEIRDGRFVRGEAFPDPAGGVERFSAVPA